MGCKSVKGLPPALSSLVPIFIPGWREALCELSIFPKEHNIMILARARPWTALSGGEHIKHKATVPLQVMAVKKTTSLDAVI